MICSFLLLGHRTFTRVRQVMLPVARRQVVYTSETSCHGFCC